MSYQIPDYLKLYPKPVMHNKFWHFRARLWNKILRDAEEESLVNSFSVFWAYVAPKEVLIEKVEVAVQWSHWFARFRAACRGADKSSEASRARAKGCLDGMTAVIRSQVPGLDVPEEWKKLYLLYSAVRTRIYQCSTLEFHRRLQADMEATVEGYLREVDVSLFTSVQEWSAHQTQVSASRSICRLIEWLHDVNLPKEALENEKLALVEQCIGDTIAYQQDIFSFRKDYIAGKGNAAYNTVQIVMMWEGKDLQEAIDRTHQLAMERLSQFRLLQEELAAGMKHGTPQNQLVRYAVVLERIVAANVHWGIGNRFFFPSSNMADDVKKTLVVKVPSV